MEICLRVRVVVLAGLAAACLARVSAAQAGPAGSSGAPTMDAPSAIVPARTFTTVTVVGNLNGVPRALIRAEAEREIKVEEKQRIAVVVPNFYTVMDGEGVPLDKTQKLKLAWHTAADPFNVAGAFVFGGLSEVQGTHRGFGWGAPGYFKRTGANNADVLDGTMLSGAVYPILLRQDPRFFRQGTGTFSSRLRHALAAPFVCRGDDGLRQANFSNVLGNFSAGAISNLYYPARERGARLTAINSSVVTLEGSLGNVGLEFAPDVQGWIERRRERRHATAVAQVAPAEGVVAGIKGSKAQPQAPGLAARGQ